MSLSIIEIFHEMLYSIMQKRCFLWREADSKRFITLACCFTFFSVFAFIFLSSVAVAQQTELRLGIPDGHNGGVTSAEYSSDGRLILTTSRDQTVILWEAVSGRVIHQFAGHTRAVHTAVFNAGQSRILTAAGEPVAYLRDPLTGTVLHKLDGHPSAITDAGFSVSGELLFTMSQDGKIIIRKSSDGSVVHSIESGLTRPTKGLFSADGKYLITSAVNGVMIQWDVTTGTKVKEWTHHKSQILDMRFNKEGDLLASASRDLGLLVRNINTGEVILSSDDNNAYSSSLQFNNTGDKILTADSDGSVRVWDLNNATIFKEYAGHLFNVINAFYSNDEKTIISASAAGDIIARNAESGGVVWQKELNNGLLTSITPGPSGRDLIASSTDNSSMILNAESGAVQHHLKRNLERIYHTAESRSGKFFSSISWGDHATIWNMEMGVMSSVLKGHNGRIFNVVFSNDESYLLSSSEDGSIIKWKTETGQIEQRYTGHRAPVWSVVLSPDNQSFISASSDSTAIIWDAVSGEKKSILTGHSDIIWVAGYSPDGKTAYTVSRDGSVILWNSGDGTKRHTLKDEAGPIEWAVYHPDGKWIATSYRSRDYVLIWDTETGLVTNRLEGHTGGIETVSFSPDGNFILTSSSDNTAIIWETGTFTKKTVLSGHIDDVTVATWSSESDLVITSSRDGAVFIWDAEEGSVIKELGRQSSPIVSARFSNDGKFLITAYSDGMILFWDSESFEWSHTLYSLQNGDYVTLHESGLFDATDGAMDQLYWIQETETIGFNQLKERFWEPGLWKKINDQEALRNVQGYRQLPLYPEVFAGSVDENGNLPVQLVKRGGGYGRVVVKINGKEIAMDARGSDFDPEQDQSLLSIRVDGHPFLVPGEENEIEIIAFEKDNWLHSRSIVVNHIPESDVVRDPPHLFVVSIGVSDYSGNAIDLRYAAKDAEDIASTLKLAGNGLFGTEKTSLFTLTSNSPAEFQPDKENIQRVFNQITAEAGTADVLIVYLAGHGISVGGSDGGDFHFLTKEAWSATAAAYSDPVLRESTTLSSGELTGFINQVPALKQVLILDTCASGQVVDDLIASRSGMESASVRALDRLRDRTGMFVLTGSAADAVSYEASNFGQGVLTYSILEAMRGAALRENEFVDVSTLFQYAADRVPVLAEGIGGIQRPQVFSPQRSESFDVGRITDEQKSLIPLAQIKPVFIRTTLVDADEFDDVLRLSALVDDLLLDISARGSDSPIIWVDARNHPNACRITGGYSQSAGKIELNARIRCGEETDERFEITAANAEEIARLLVELVER